MYVTEVNEKYAFLSCETSSCIQRKTSKKYKSEEKINFEIQRNFSRLKLSNTFNSNGNIFKNRNGEVPRMSRFRMLPVKNTFINVKGVNLTSTATQALVSLFQKDDDTK